MQVSFFSTFSSVVMLAVSGANAGELEEIDRAKPVSSKPNIVLILADDLGYGDVQSLNPISRVSTPSLNSLADEGVSFTDAHSPSAVCTPTRYGILCGKYCWRTRLKQGVLGGYSTPLIDPNQQTIASMLQSSGYDTACVGKWHLGLGWQWRNELPKNINFFGIAGKPGSVDFSKPVSDGPADHGFRYSHIIPASLDMSPYVYLENNQTTGVVSNIIEGKSFPSFYRKGEIAEDFKIEGCLGHLTDKAVEFVENHAHGAKPFFLYVPLPAPHKPVVPTAEFQGKSKLGFYADFVMQVDHAVGKILRSIDDNDIRENTVVIFTSDNGSYMHRIEPDQPDHVDDPKRQGYRTEHHKPNGDLRGTKADIWEGGHRVPFFVRWPAQLKTNRQSDRTITHTDILATVAEIAETTFDAGASPDSYSFLDQLVSSKNGDSVRPPVIHHSVGGMFAIRKGKWKLVLGNGSGGRQKPKGKKFARPYHLFDLSNDLGEKVNLIEQYPEIAADLEEQFEQIAKGDQRRKDKAPTRQLWCEYPGGAGRGAGKHIVLIAGDDEYRSEEALPMLGKILSVRHGFKCTVLFPINPEDGTIKPDYQKNIPGMQAIDTADLIILGLRFRNLPDDDMKHFVDYVDAGKPIIGLRTSTHAFNYPKDSRSPFANYSFNSKTWKGGFGQQVLGDTWISHHGRHGKESCRGVVNEQQRTNPILKGAGDVWGKTDVYGIVHLPESATVLMYGQVLDGMTPRSKAVEGKKNNPMMPLVWTKDFTSESGKVARIFCTTMGASTDFESEGLRRLVVNASYWCLGMEDQIPASANVEIVGEYQPSNFGFGSYEKGKTPADYDLKKQ